MIFARLEYMGFSENSLPAKVYGQFIMLSMKNVKSGIVFVSRFSDT